jgi:hypothetical protein
MDFIVKLPVSKDSLARTSFDSIFIVVDRLTKWAHFIPCNEGMDAEQLATLFIQHIFSLHGLPLSIVSDRDPLFTSRFTRSLARQAHIQQKLSTAYHPQTDGQTEHVNQILEQYLRMYCNYQQDNWVSLLPLAQFAYNNSEHSSTNTSPFFANYGYHPRFTVTMHSTSSPAADEHMRYLCSLHQYLKVEIQRAVDNQARFANTARSLAPIYTIGEEVWLLRHHISTTRPSDKLDNK